jgi:hypothetical protein
LSVSEGISLRRKEVTVLLSVMEDASLVLTAQDLFSSEAITSYKVLLHQVPNEEY